MKEWVKWGRQGFIDLKDLRMIPLKCPLGSNWNEYVENEHRFTVQMFCNYQKSKGRHVGMIIHLKAYGAQDIPLLGCQFSDEFYSKDDIEFLEKSEISRVSLEIGKDASNKDVNEAVEKDGQMGSFLSSIPSQDEISLFVKLVSNYTQNHPDKYVAVHCTSGYILTGYLLVSYLVEEADFSVDAALKAFAIGREPGIFSHSIVKNLYMRFDDLSSSEADRVAEFSVSKPPISILEGDRSISLKSNSSKSRLKQESLSPNQPESPPRKVMKKLNSNSNEQFSFPSLPSAVRVKPPHLQRIQKAFEKFIGSRNSFQVLISNRHRLDSVMLNSIGGIENILEANYMITWRTPPLAIRSFLMILREGSFLIPFMENKEFSPFHVPGLSVPYRKNPSEKVDQTLIEGEYVVSTSSDRKSKFLISDIVSFQGQSLKRMSLKQRLQCAKTEIIEPLSKSEGESKHGLHIRQKIYFPFSELQNLIEKVIPALDYPTSGFIATRENANYPTRAEEQNISPVDGADNFKSLPFSFEWESESQAESSVPLNALL